MNFNELVSKNKLSLDGDDKNFKQKTRKETNLLSSSIKYYRKNQIQVDVTSLDTTNGNTACRSYFFTETTKASKAVKKKIPTFLIKAYLLAKTKLNA